MQRKILSIAVLAFLVFVTSAFARTEGEYISQVRLGLGKKPAKGYRVLQVYDFETFEVEDVGTVRLIGVSEIESDDVERDIESVREATNYVQELVGGKNVGIEYDDADAYTNYQDEADRTLAYVFLIDEASQAAWSDAEYERVAALEKKEGTEPDPEGIRKQKIDFCKREFAQATEKRDKKASLNALLIREGYACVSTARPFAYREDFRALESEAKLNNRGFWS